MKKILLITFIIFSTNIFSQVLTFETGDFNNKEEVIITKKEYSLFKRPYNSEIDGTYKIDQIKLIPNSTKAVINFMGQNYYAKYYMYPDTEQTIYLFKIIGLDNFSITLTRESGKIRFLYTIPNKGLFSKENLRDIPKEDISYLKSIGFTDEDIKKVDNNSKFSIFYTGFVTFN